MFYASDPKLNANGGSLGCETKTNFAELKACSASLQGVDGKISGFEAFPVSSAEDLKKLREKILSDVRSNRQRDTLPNWNSFAAELEKLSTPQIVETQLPIEPGMQTEGDLTPEDTTQKGTQMVETAPADTGFLGMPKIWTLIALALSIVAIYLSTKKPDSRQQRREASFSPGNTNDNSAQMQRDIEKLQMSLRTLEEDLRRINTNQAVSGKQKPPEEKSLEKVVEHTPVPAAKPQNTVTLKYAKTADGNGFQADTLSDQTDDKKIFEIRIDGGNRATYRVTTNRNAQLFALEDPANYLRGACTYTGNPSRESRINTTKAGTLELQGGKWTILNPAEIEFT